MPQPLCDQFRTLPIVASVQDAQVLWIGAPVNIGGPLGHSGARVRPSREVPGRAIRGLARSARGPPQRAPADRAPLGKTAITGPRCGRLGPSEAVREGDHVVESLLIQLGSRHEKACGARFFPTVDNPLHSTASTRYFRMTLLRPMTPSDPRSLAPLRRLDRANES